VKHEVAQWNPFSRFLFFLSSVAAILGLLFIESAIGKAITIVGAFLCLISGMYILEEIDTAITALRGKGN